MSHHLTGVLLARLCVLALIFSASASAGENRTVVLDTTGFWRVHYTHKPPVEKTAGGEKPVKLGVTWLDSETAEPPQDWTAREFDDSAWRRLPGMTFPVHRPSWLKFKDIHFGFTANDMSSPYMSHVAMRGKFQVDDPAKAGDMLLTLNYRGGVVAYLNGKEVARGDMPDGKVTSGTHAKDYPEEAFLTPDGKLLVFSSYKGDSGKELRRRSELHNRKLEAVKIPAKLLKRGVNILSVSVHRAAYPEKAVVRKKERRGTSTTITWSTCGLS